MGDEDICSNNSENIDMEGLNKMALTVAKHDEHETDLDDGLIVEDMHGTVENIFFSGESIVDPFWITPMGGKFAEQIRSLYYREWTVKVFNQMPIEDGSEDQGKKIENEPRLLLEDATITEDDAIYKVHAKGHKVLLSRYSKNKQRIISTYASQENLHTVLCLLKCPLIVDCVNLSRLQLSAILKELKKLGDHITIDKVRNNARMVIVAKYKE